MRVPKYFAVHVRTVDGRGGNTAKELSRLQGHLANIQVARSVIIEERNSCKETQLKQKPNDKCRQLDVGDDYNIESVDFRKAIKVETLPFNKLPVIHIDKAIVFLEKIDDKISAVSDCKDVKPTSLPTSICKIKSQSFQPIVELESQIHTSNVNEKKLTILLKNGFNYANNRQFQVNPQLKIKKSEEIKLFEKRTKTNLSQKGRRTHKSTNQKTRIRLTNKSIKPYKCKICNKSFRVKAYLKAHINIVHDRCKLFECDICHKSFGYKHTLKNHIHAVHKFSKTFECDICHESFFRYGNFARHLSSVHNRIKPFECEICHKSFSSKRNCDRHLSSVHNRIKPFECETCHKSFGYKNALKKHIMAVHNQSKPKYNICRQSLGNQYVHISHVTAVHDHSKSLECNFCRKSFVVKNTAKSHDASVHYYDKPFRM
uniref:C2H2-type domain-containing protein n=1 Tax=Trichogramma kaykai TaxID=54128 RepID=A0ABD2WLS8_9HYME